MPLQPRSGNMYEWVTHQYAHLARLLPEAALLAQPKPTPKPNFKFECPACGSVEIFHEITPTVACRVCAGRFKVTNTLALDAVASALFPGARP